MLADVQPFAETWRKLRKGELLGEAPIRLVRFLEKRFGAKFLYDSNSVPFGRFDLIDLFEIAARLQEAGVIHETRPNYRFADEPQFKQWVVECGTKDKHMAGGMATEDDRDALIPALAEAVERFLWFTQTDYLGSTKRMTAKGIQEHGPAILPNDFVGFTKKQRSENPRLLLREDAEYLWTLGFSHTHDRETWLPAQTVNSAHGYHSTVHGHEPLILTPITTGLATGPTREFALLNGMLEILERDAFMITWLNQLTPPRIDIDELAKSDAELNNLLKMCRQYRLNPSAVRLPTDAPTYAVCAVVTDKSGQGPEVTLGLKSHRSIVSAVRGSLLEALRIRHTVRIRDINTPLKPDVVGSTINHLERAQYWGRPGSAAKLTFLTAGDTQTLIEEPWEKDTLEQHWRRLVSWCKENNYECASVNVGRSKLNVSPWKVEMLVMPQMQPMHQNERLIYLGGDRLTNIPKQFGYTPRTEPYRDEPHPFA